MLGKQRIVVTRQPDRRVALEPDALEVGALADRLLQRLERGFLERDDGEGEERILVVSDQAIDDRRAELTGQARQHVFHLLLGRLAVGLLELPVEADDDLIDDVRASHGCLPR